MKAGEYIPISRTFPHQKVLMDDNARKRPAAKPSDLRVSGLGTGDAGAWDVGATVPPPNLLRRSRAML